MVEGHATYSLPCGRITLLDLEDSWITALYNLVGTDRYVRVRCYSSNQDFALSRLLMDCHDRALVVDHINRDSFDNRKANLRIVTQSENNINRRNFGAYPIGVTYSTHRGKYIARITHNGVRHTLGAFMTVAEACDAYNHAARKFYGDMAPFSNPEGYV